MKMKYTFELDATHVKRHMEAACLDVTDAEADRIAFETINAVMDGGVGDVWEHVRTVAKDVVKCRRSYQLTVTSDWDTEEVGEFHSVGDAMAAAERHLQEGRESGMEASDIDWQLGLDGVEGTAYVRFVDCEYYEPVEYGIEEVSNG